jgi:hypothetical protein
MRNRDKGNIVVALVLIAIGLWFLAVELFPALKDWVYGTLTWPAPIIGVGVLLALIGLLTWNPDLMIPACIVAGIGGLLYYQNSSGNWGSWAYAWALIPGFAGVGALLAGILQGKRGAAIGGLWTILSSLLLFAIFGSFLGGSNLLGKYWPVLLIALGLLILVQGLVRRRE